MGTSSLTLKGFKDYPPDRMLPKKALIETVEKNFRLFGYLPMDTPSLEYSKFLIGQEETEKQLFRFTDSGGRDVALRFDLTVPLARFFAAHARELGTPFRRYHIGNVWRAEKPQKGRYREFLQCDIDILGANSIAADAELLALICKIIDSLGLSFQVKVNHRGLLSKIFALLGIEKTQEQNCLRALDKLSKIGISSIKKELVEVGIKKQQIDLLLQIIAIENNEERLESIIFQIQTALPSLEDTTPELLELRSFFEIAEHMGYEKQLSFNPSIARGLDYYTGIVFETFLVKFTEIGSISSGGRYDDLTERFGLKGITGTGASIGLDRLLVALEEINPTWGKGSPVQVLVVWDQDRMQESIDCWKNLHSSGISAEIFPGKAKLAKQFKYANRKGISYVCIPKINEKFSLKNLTTGKQREMLALKEISQIIKRDK